MNDITENQDHISNNQQIKTPPRNWYQWLLVYPTFGLAVLGAIPTIIDATKALIYDVERGTTKLAEVQHSLFEKNLNCMKDKGFNTVVNQQNVEIATKVCDSGDVLLHGKRSNWSKGKLKWIAWGEIAPITTSTASLPLDFFISNAHASGINFREVDSADLSNSLYPGQVLCQKWVGNGLLMQVVFTGNNSCIDQVVNTYNGLIIKRVNSTCRQYC